MPQPAPTIVFAGTPDFAVPSLEALLNGGWPVVGVYTQPDRPAGRGRRPRASPVKERALAAGLPVFQPPTLGDPIAQAELAALKPVLMVVAAYGLILSREVLDIPPRGCLNVHASLLPRWRGAAPIQRAILAGDRESGVCLMQMETGLDTGPVYDCRSVAIEGDTTGGQLHDRLAVLGGELLGERLADILAGRLQAQPQDQARACYASKLEKLEARLDWSRPAPELARRVRAFNPWPVAWSTTQRGPLRVWEAYPEASSPGAGPGVVLSQAP
ncbi:MAG: methionyl-tRNA formyltransferase, partial [Candidatus Competibacteraceae bacterium]|nr:methionyl-tRNA formyltransferase [Candidatus Competibacteraceae bacterium]